MTVQDLRLNICYYYQDLHYRPLHPGSPLKLLSNLHVRLLGGPLAHRSIIGRSFQRHQFLGPIHSTGELLHTPEQISTSMTTALLSKQIDTFCGVHINNPFGPLNGRSVHPASPALLTKDGPLMGKAFENCLPVGKTTLIAN